MSVPELHQLEDEAKNVIFSAKRDGTLSYLTARIIRERIEVLYGLELGTLDVYKQSLKTAIQEATCRVQGFTTQTNIPSVASAEPSDTGMVMVNRNASARLSTRKPHCVSKASNKVYKSVLRLMDEKEIIECSDLDDLPENESNRGSLNKDKENLPKKVATKIIEITTASPTPIKRRKIKHNGGGKSAENMLRQHQEGLATNSSDPMISPLFGDSQSTHPVSNGKKATKKAVKGEVIAKVKAKSSDTSSTQDDVIIKRLKSFVNACGVRKIWLKVFEDCPKPLQQINKLKEILAALGMTGRMSMEQAKRIRARRELAQELEDVKSFEQSVLNRDSRRSRATSSMSELVNDYESGASDEDVKPTVRKRKALQSIDAFLEGQSDSDED